MVRSQALSIAAALLLAAGAIFGSGYWLGSSQEPALDISWLGAPVFVTGIDAYDPGIYSGEVPFTYGTRRNVELGLRADGSVVWRAQARLR